MREAPQLVVDERERAVEGRAVAGGGQREEVGDALPGVHARPWLVSAGFCVFPEVRGVIPRRGPIGSGAQYRAAHPGRQYGRRAVRNGDMAYTKEERMRRRSMLLLVAGVIAGGCSRDALTTAPEVVPEWCGARDRRDAGARRRVGC